MKPIRVIRQSPLRCAFTEQVLNVWNNGSFSGNYATFHAAVRSRMPSTQSPNLFTLGKPGSFLTQAPFNV